MLVRLIAGFAMLLSVTPVDAQSWLSGPLSHTSNFDRLTLIGVVGEDERRLSAFPYVANIGGGTQSMATGVVVGRRHLITAAHLFVTQGNWSVTGIDRPPVGRELRIYRVFIEGCPNQVYGISKIFVPTNDPQAFRKRDYAVVQLDQPHCGVSAALWSMTDGEVGRYLYGEGSDPDPRPVTAVGYYSPTSIELYDQSATLETAEFDGLEFDLVLAWQYAAEGRVVNENHDVLFRDDGNGPQRLLVHRIDAAVGGSGGPLIVRDGEENYVVGMHIGERSDRSDVNFAIRISDGFLDLITEHVPDAVIRRDTP